MRTTLWVVAVGIGLAACATTRRPGDPEERSSQDADVLFREHGMAAARFDLQCQAEPIDLIVLKPNTFTFVGCTGSQVGARGCGKQTTYQCDRTGAWVRTSEVSQR